jgi:ADP-ribose pyrophosphatase
MRLPSSTRTAFEGAFVKVDVETWPGIGSYEVVRRPDAAGLVALTPDGKVLLVRQFRPPVRREVTEIPAGLLDVEGESPADCAARELIEETGYRHSTMESLGGFYTSVGLTPELVHLFLARTQEEPVGEPEAGVELLRLPFERMVAAAKAGEVQDAKTAIALLLAADRLAERIQP